MANLETSLSPIPSDLKAVGASLAISLPTYLSETEFFSLRYRLREKLIAEALNILGKNGEFQVIEPISLVFEPQIQEATSRFIDEILNSEQEIQKLPVFDLNHSARVLGRGKERSVKERSGSRGLKEESSSSERISEVLGLDAFLDVLFKAFAEPRCGLKVCSLARSGDAYLRRVLTEARDLGATYILLGKEHRYLEGSHDLGLGSKEANLQYWTVKESLSLGVKRFLIDGELVVISSELEEVADSVLEILIKARQIVPLSASVEISASISLEEIFTEIKSLGSFSLSRGTSDYVAVPAARSHSNWVRVSALFPISPLYYCDTCKKAVVREEELSEFEFRFAERSREGILNMSTLDFSELILSSSSEVKNLANKYSGIRVILGLSELKINLPLSAKLCELREAVLLLLQASIQLESGYREAVFLCSLRSLNFSSAELSGIRYLLEKIAIKGAKVFALEATNSYLTQDFGGPEEGSFSSIIQGPNVKYIVGAGVLARDMYQAGGALSSPLKMLGFFDLLLLQFSEGVRARSFLSANRVDLKSPTSGFLCSECEGIGKKISANQFGFVVISNCEVCSSTGFNSDVLLFESYEKKLHEVLAMNLPDFLSYLLTLPRFIKGDTSSNYLNLFDLLLKNERTRRFLENVSSVSTLMIDQSEVSRTIAWLVLVLMDGAREINYLENNFHKNEDNTGPSLVFDCNLASFLSLFDQSEQYRERSLKNNKYPLFLDVFDDKISNSLVSRILYLYQDPLKSSNSGAS